MIIVLKQNRYLYKGHFIISLYTASTFTERIVNIAQKWWSYFNIKLLKFLARMQNSIVGNFRWFFGNSVYFYT